MTDFSDKWLVDTDWLAEHLDVQDLVVLDASWYLPDAGRDPYREYLQQRIPGAVFFDIDKIADTSVPLPHMLPAPEQFSSAMKKLGIGDGMRVVVYDSGGMFSAARVWWTFRAMGNDGVSVLNGGLSKWKTESHPLEDGPARTRPARHYTSSLNGDLVRGRDDIVKIISDRSEQIVDARSAERFHGQVPEPRAGLRAGHIPGSLNLPFAELLNSNGTFKPTKEIKLIFENAGVDLSRPVANSCGSGVTASILALALAILGHPQASVYDGSWSEWGADASLPIATQD